MPDERNDRTYAIDPAELNKFHEKLELLLIKKLPIAFVINISSLIPFNFFAMSHLDRFAIIKNTMQKFKDRWLVHPQYYQYKRDFLIVSLRLNLLRKLKIEHVNDELGEMLEQAIYQHEMQFDEIITQYEMKISPFLYILKQYVSPTFFAKNSGQRIVELEYLLDDENFRRFLLSPDFIKISKKFLLYVVDNNREALFKFKLNKKPNIMSETSVFGIKFYQHPMAKIINLMDECLEVLTLKDEDSKPEIIVNRYTANVSLYWMLKSFLQCMKCKPFASLAFDTLAGVAATKTEEKARAMASPLQLRRQLATLTVEVEQVKPGLKSPATTPFQISPLTGGVPVTPVTPLPGFSP